jgi:hypothetical protein
MLRSRILTVILSTMTALGCATELHATCNTITGGYDGVIDDKYPIALVIDTGRGINAYAYNTSERTIPVKPEITTIIGVSTIRITEFDESGRPSAIFEGTFQDKDPRRRFKPPDSKLECEVITGTWRSLKDGRVLPFYLSASGSPMGFYENAAKDAHIEEKAVHFRQAVLKKDKKFVAASIRYPIHVNLDGDEKHRTRISKASELISLYDRIFIPRYVQNIREDVPLLMFANMQGIMLGNGDVWFDFKGQVITLNIFPDNPSPLERLRPRLDAK